MNSPRPARYAVCAECGEPVRACPPGRWLVANGPRPGWSHTDGEPLCATYGPTGAVPAQPRWVPAAPAPHTGASPDPAAPRPPVTTGLVRASRGLPDPGPTGGAPGDVPVSVTGGHPGPTCGQGLDDKDNQHMHDGHDGEYGPDGPDTCAAEYVTGGHDPYGTECELAPGHHGSHIGADPFGNAGRVQWSGGGWAGGDPLPYREVRWIT